MTVLGVIFDTAKTQQKTQQKITLIIIIITLYHFILTLYHFISLKVEVSLRILNLRV